MITLVDLFKTTQSMAQHIQESVISFDACSAFILFTKISAASSLLSPETIYS